MSAGIRRVVLIGSMGSGKSTVGRELADLWGWTFADADEVVEREAGCSVADVFAAEGERGFRARERKVMSGLLREAACVIASGGGWASEPGVWDALPDGTRTVWLRVSTRVALERALADGGRERPLLSGPDPMETLERLRRDRAASYERADLSIDTEGARPREIAERIATALKESQ
ncbi:MAG: shikimate kinase [Gemmatimonadota bacterium]